VPFYRYWKYNASVAVKLMKFDAYLVTCCSAGSISDKRHILSKSKIAMLGDVPYLCPYSILRVSCIQIKPHERTGIRISVRPDKTYLYYFQSKKQNRPTPLLHVRVQLIKTLISSNEIRHFCSHSFFVTIQLHSNQIDKPCITSSIV